MMDDALPAGMRLALEGGIGHQREYVRFWERVLKKSSRGPRAAATG